MTTENQNASALDFTATDSEGKIRKLSDYRGKNNVVLIFNRGFF
jgi:peroxiredoxin